VNYNVVGSLAVINAFRYMITGQDNSKHSCSYMYFRK